MENIKILLIGNNSYEFEGIVKVCTALGIEPYPSEEKARALIFAAAVDILTPYSIDSNFSKKVILSRLNLYLDGASFEKTVCIFDYQLDLYDLRINGVRFHEKFFGANPVIFIHPTVHEPEVETIMEYCADHEDRFFLPNTKSLYWELEELIKAFKAGKKLNTVV